MSFSVVQSSSSSSPSLSTFPQTKHRQFNPLLNLLIIPKSKRHSRSSLKRSPTRLLASRRIYNSPQEGDILINDPRHWSRAISSEFYIAGDDDEDDEEEEEEEDRSLDLLVKFVQNMFKKISRRARKAVRSVLPQSIPSKLVRFSVNGVLLLAFLWILKAFLEVICTLGSVVFVSILLIRGIWTGIIFAQENRSRRSVSELDYDPRIWNGVQPAS